MKSTVNDRYHQELAEFQRNQEDMLRLSQEYGQARLAAWARELQEMEQTWASFQQDWQGTLEHLSGLAFSKFEEIAASGEAAGNHLRLSWKQALAEISGDMETWAGEVLKALGRVNQAWPGTTGGGGANFGGDWLSWLGGSLGFGGWFHQGGLVEAHRGMVVGPETLLAEEQMVVVQTGEGILPRESMLRLGEQNFEALRRGQFDLAPQTSAPPVNFTVQVQTLDAAGVAGLDWHRVVQRHLLPVLQQEMARRW